MKVAPLALSQMKLAEMVLTRDGTVTAIITPQIASWLLELNTFNRPTNEARVMEFVRRLQTGVFRNTGEPVIVSREGTINDGQHRLQAVARCDLSVELDVRFGIPQAAILDTGLAARRSNGDTLSMRNERNASILAAIVRGYILHERGSAVLSGAVDPREVVECLDRVPVLREIANLVRTLQPMKAICQSWFGVALGIISKTNRIEHIQKFADAVLRRQGEEGSGAVLLHTRLVKEMGERTKLRPVDRIWLTLRAWDLWAVGHRQGKLQLPTDTVVIPSSVEVYQEIGCREKGKR